MLLRVPSYQCKILELDMDGQERREQNSAMAFCFLPVILALCLLLSHWQGLAVLLIYCYIHDAHRFLPWQAPWAWKTICNYAKSVLRLGILCTSGNVQELPPVGIVGFSYCTSDMVGMPHFKAVPPDGQHQLSLAAILPSDFPSRTILSYLFCAKVCWFVRPGVKCQRQPPQKNYTNSSLQVRVQHVSERLSHFWWCLGGISQRPVGTTKWYPKAHDM